VSDTAGAIAERTVVVNGVRLATVVNTVARAALGRPPLIVLPAAGFTLGDYRPVLDAFAPERRVAALDWPGFGASERPAVDAFAYSAQGYADLLDGWLNAVGGTRVVLLGSGVGGAAAVRFALARPQRVAGLVLVAPWGFGAPGIGRAMAARMLGSRWLLAQVESSLLSLAVGPANPATRQVIAAHRAQSTQRAQRAASTAAHAALWRADALPAAHLAVAARALQVPAIVIRGSLDPLFSAADLRRASAAIGPHGALAVVLPGAGHLPFLQQPEAFMRAVRGLLESVELG
jgi:pimeloyl-ACP methyl ester carboxylesterase